MEINVRSRWVVLSDADKCRYNGYSDFVDKETTKIRHEKFEESKN